ncbi:MAG: LLM class flavin-dependent oxidoreductase [Acidimicrobiia bacterium]|nr:LLM class flavin-dependent oxidoreductase [Acidimicrobiia bacterium]
MGDTRGPKAFAVRAEATGFDSVWCGDHVGHLVDGIAALGCLAGATEEITVGVNVLVTPHRPAVVTAKGLATIALVAPGRVVAGFGVGGEFPDQLSATGADMRTRGAYTDEALEVTRPLWSGGPVSHRGRWAQLDDFRIEPAPVPAPDIWIGGRSEAALRRTVRFGTGYVPYLVSPEQLGRRRQRLAELALEADRAPEELTIACLVTLIPARSVDEAVERGLSSLRLSGLTPESVRAQYLLGDDESVVARLQDYADAGADHLILGCLPGEDRQLDEFFDTCARLLPAARQLRRAALPGHR